MNVEKLIKTIKGFIPPRAYRMRTIEINTVWEAAHGDTFYCIMYAFNYGFIQGQRAAKAEAKREKRRLIERDATGWYGYLSRWLERNIDNERLLALVGRSAREMEEEE